MIKSKYIVLLLITVFMCLFVSCTGEPAVEEKQQIYYPTIFQNQSTEATTKVTASANSTRKVKKNRKAKIKDVNNNSTITSNTAFSENITETTVEKSNTKKHYVIVGNGLKDKNTSTIINTVKTTNFNYSTKSTYNNSTAQSVDDENVAKITSRQTQPTLSKTSIIVNNTTVVDKPEVSNITQIETTSQTKTTTQTENITTEQIQTTTEITTLAPLSDSEVCYITASGEKYHRQGCRYLKKSCIEIVVLEAKEKGYTPCKVCKP